MEGQEFSEGKIELLDCESSTESLPGSENFVFDGSGLNEKVLLEELDSCLEDIGSRLIVSRMVSDSVVKGIVNAVAQEASEEIDLKETEIEVLKKMFFSESDRSQCHSCGSWLAEATSGGSELEVKIEQLDRSIFLDDMRLISKKQIQMLKDDIEQLQNMDLGGVGAYENVFNQHRIPEHLSKINSRVDLLSSTVEALYRQFSEHCCLHKEFLVEQQWRWNLAKEVQNIAVGHYIEDMREDFRMKLCEEEYFCRNQRKYWSKKRKDLSALREELDAISVSLFGSEQENLEICETWSSASKKKFSQNALAHRFSPCLGNGDITSVRTKNPTAEIDMTHLAHLSREEFVLKKELTKEELITYYLTEMAKMSRQHETALQEKTEELFRLKRQLLKERGSSPFKKDKEFEMLRKKIPEFISTLDDILGVEGNDQLLIVKDGHHDLICNLKDQISVLLAEKKYLNDLLASERKEVKHLSSRISDAVMQMSYHTSSEIKLLEQIRKLKQALEDTRVEAALQNEVVNIVFRNLVCTFRHVFQNSQVEVYTDRDIHLLVLRESLNHAIFFVKNMLERHEKEEIILRGDLLKKEKASSLEVLKNKNLEDKLESLSRLIQEKENMIHEKETIANTNMGMFVLQREKYDLLLQELNLLCKQKEEQAILLLDNEHEINQLKSRLEDATSQVMQYDMEMKKIDERLKIAQVDLNKLEQQMMDLVKLVHAEKMKASSAISDKDLVVNEMKALTVHIIGLSKSLDELESKMNKKIQRNESRLEKLKHKLVPMCEMVHSLHREVSVCRQNLEIKMSNLRTAEDEVDLLGDEVEALLSVLAKVYITLDHYSHVLQHYPGVMEILKLVRTELERSVKPSK